MTWSILLNCFTVTQKQRQCILILICSFYFSISFQVTSPFLQTSNLFPTRPSVLSSLWKLKGSSSTPEDIKNNKFSSKLVVGVPMEIGKREKRVGLSPEAVSMLTKFNYSVLIESNAGKEAFSNDDYILHGATIVSRQEVWKSDIIVKVEPPTYQEAKAMKYSSILISFMQAADNQDMINYLHQTKNITIYALDQVPRNISTKSRYFDAIYSQAYIAGYRAIIEGISQCEQLLLPRDVESSLLIARDIETDMMLKHLQKGDISPLRILVLGGGISGVAAIKTAKALDATVYCYDCRSVVRSMVESLGATYLFSSRQNENQAEDLLPILPTVDVVICTIIPSINIPSKPLITKEMIRSTMRSGSVIVDMSILPDQKSGLIEGARTDEVVSISDRLFRHKVKIIGYTDFPSRMARIASQLFANHIVNLLVALQEDGNVQQKTWRDSSLNSRRSIASEISAITSRYWFEAETDSSSSQTIRRQLLQAMKLHNPFHEIEERRKVIHKQQQLRPVVVDQKSEASSSPSKPIPNSATISPSTTNPILPPTTVSSPPTEKDTSREEVLVNSNQELPTTNSVSPSSSSVALAPEPEEKRDVVNQEEVVEPRLRVIDMDMSFTREYNLMATTLSPSVANKSEETQPMILLEQEEASHMTEEDYRYYYEDEDEVIAEENDSESNETESDKEIERDEEKASKDPIEMMQVSLQQIQQDYHSEEVSLPNLLRCFVAIIKLWIEFHTNLFNELTNQLTYSSQRSSSSSLSNSSKSREK